MSHFNIAKYSKYNGPWVYHLYMKLSSNGFSGQMSNRNEQFHVDMITYLSPVLNTDLSSLL